MATANLTAEQILALEALRDEAAKIRAGRDALHAKAAHLHYQRDVLPVTIAYYLDVTPATVNRWLTEHRPPDTEPDAAGARDWRQERYVKDLARSYLRHGAHSEVAYSVVLALEKLEAAGYDVTMKELINHIVEKARSFYRIIDKYLKQLR